MKIKVKPLKKDKTVELITYLEDSFKSGVVFFFLEDDLNTPIMYLVAIIWVCPI